MRCPVVLLAFLISFTNSYAQGICRTPILPTPDPNGRTVSVRRYARIPDVGGNPPRIVSTIHFQGDLYVCTSTSGGLIYKVTQTGAVSLFFDVASAMAENDTPMDFTNPQHGGLRSVAFHPKFNKNGLFYVSTMQERNQPPESLTYLSRTDDLIEADSVVLEFKFEKATNTTPASSMRTVLRVGMDKYDHPVKQMMFRGKFLYICHGDGSVQSAFAGGGQRNDALGKILRINPKKKGEKPYRVPKSNPFTNDDSWLNELYAVGFRNPHNLCFSKRGELFVTDTGRDNFEEINIVKAGNNYGWSKREGTFVHLNAGGGIGCGVDPIPDNDTIEGFEYPVVQVEHVGPLRKGFVGQALAGSCPIENGSEMSGTMMYINFPTDGKLYYSFLKEMRKARTVGKPKKLRQAKTWVAKILFDDDDDPNTPSIPVPNFLEIVRLEPGKQSQTRADVRFGQGPKGEIYVSSKKTGYLYLIESTKKNKS